MSILHRGQKYDADIESEIRRTELARAQPYRETQRRKWFLFSSERAVGRTQGGWERRTETEKEATNLLVIQGVFQSSCRRPGHERRGSPRWASAVDQMASPRRYLLHVVTQLTLVSTAASRHFRRKHLSSLLWQFTARLCAHEYTHARLYKCGARRVAEGCRGG